MFFSSASIAHHLWCNIKLAVHAPPISPLHAVRFCLTSSVVASNDGLVEQERFADVFDFGDGAFEVECFGEDDLEDLTRHMY